MSVSSEITLPAQPGVGRVDWVPLGGDGVTAPQGYYDIDVQLVGDASGGTASIVVNFDIRYTSLISFVNAKIEADTAAGEFSLDLERSAGISGGVHVVGTFPGITEGVVLVNSAYLWYPPPIFYAGDGRARFFCVNVDATSTSGPKGSP